MRNLIEALLDAVAPRRCPGCNEVCAKSWCDACGEPEPLPDAGSVAGVPVIVGGVYSGALARAISRFKYEPRPELAAPLGRLLVAIAQSRVLPEDLAWTPVPLHFERLVERGFNQSALLARELARATRQPMCAQLLCRQRDTGHQVELGRSERAANVRDAFQVRAPSSRAVVLVDDVVTTGATAQACIEALRKKEVHVHAVFALARTVPGRGPSPRTAERPDRGR
jgi:ComF family protein